MSAQPIEAMKATFHFSYNGREQPKAPPERLRDLVRPYLLLGMTGEYRCACQGMTDTPIGVFYCGNRSNPEWIIRVERES